MRHLDRALHRRRRQPAAADTELEVNAREHLRVGRGAFRLQLDAAALHRVAAARRAHELEAAGSSARILVADN